MNRLLSATVVVLSFYSAAAFTAGNVTGWCVDENEITVTKAFECSGEYFMSRSRNDAERAQEKVPGFLLCKRYFVACDGC